MLLTDDTDEEKAEKEPDIINRRDIPVSLTSVNKPVGWAEGSGWTTCSITCAGYTGIRLRHRHCQADIPSSCDGADSQLEKCVTKNYCKQGEHSFMPIRVCFSEC